MITTGHTCFGSSETEVEPTYRGADFLRTSESPSLLAIQNNATPLAARTSRHEQYQEKTAGQSDITHLHALLWAQKAFNIIFMQKERDLDREGAIA